MLLTGKISLKKFLTISAITLIIALMFSGCYNSYDNYTENNDDRLTLVYHDGFVKIYADNETGVQYIGSEGFCVMVDENGEPLIYNEE